jgi:hypothetical protein
MQDITYVAIACVAITVIVSHCHQDKEKPKHILYDPQYGDRWGREAKEKGL